MKHVEDLVAKTVYRLTWRPDLAQRPRRFVQQAVDVQEVDRGAHRPTRFQDAEIAVFAPSCEPVAARRDRQTLQARFHPINNDFASARTCSTAESPSPACPKSSTQIGGSQRSANLLRHCRPHNNDSDRWPRQDQGEAAYHTYRSVVVQLAGFSNTRASWFRPTSHPRPTPNEAIQQLTV